MVSNGEITMVNTNSVAVYRNSNGDKCHYQSVDMTNDENIDRDNTDDYCGGEHVNSPISSGSNLITNALGVQQCAKDNIKIELPDKFNRLHHSDQHHFNHHDRKTVCCQHLSEFTRAIISFIILFVAMVANLFVLSIVHELVPTDFKRPLPDLGFFLLPKIDWTLDIAEYIILAISLLTIFMLFIHRHRLVIFKRISLVMSIVYFLRAICMASTVFPIANRNYYCEPQLNRTVSVGKFVPIAFSRVGYMLVGLGLSINGHHSYCGDYLFSGHTLIITLGYLFLRQYLIPLRCRTIAWKLFNLLLLLACLSAVICIIIARGHYLIDIVLGYYASTRIFWMYHTVVNNASLMLPSANNFISRVWWFRFISIFENTPSFNETAYDQKVCHSCHLDGPHSISRTFEWPLPWPRVLRRRTLLRYQQRLLVPATDA